MLLAVVLFSGGKYSANRLKLMGLKPELIKPPSTLMAANTANELTKPLRPIVAPDKSMSIPRVTFLLTLLVILPNQMPQAANGMV